MPAIAHRTLDHRLAARLRELNSAGLLRKLAPPSGIDLSSNDYLALANDARIRDRMAAAARSEGCGSTGSRLLRGERPAFSHIEHRFAAFKETESALYFSSGYAANVGVLSALLEPGDLVFSDALNHASLIDGVRLGRAERVIFPHADAVALRRLLHAAPDRGQRFVVTESLFSMDGDFAPLKEYAELCEETGAALIVDEAHAVGIYGARGTGLIEGSGIASSVFLSINPAGKALGVSGAFAAGPSLAIDYLIQRSRSFIFSTAPPLPIAAALDSSLDLIESEPQRRARVLHLASFLRRLLRESGFDVSTSDSPIIPVILGDNHVATRVAEEMQAAGFDVRAIRPPTVPEGTARLRISVHADLDEATLARFAALLAQTVYQ